jgi:hypothetical protein
MESCGTSEMEIANEIGAVYRPHPFCWESLAMPDIQQRLI